VAFGAEGKRHVRTLSPQAGSRRLETGGLVETIAADLNNKADLARIETTLGENARSIR
jgi:hypothetical protein